MDKRFLTPEVIHALDPFFERIETELQPINGKRIVIWPAAIEGLAFRLAAKIGNGHVTAIAPDSDRKKGLKERIKAEGLMDRLEIVHTRRWPMQHIPHRMDQSDAFLDTSELFSTNEMWLSMDVSELMVSAIRPGGYYLYFIGVTQKPVMKDVEMAFGSLGFDLHQDGTKEVLEGLRSEGFTDVAAIDITDLLIPAWTLCRGHPRFEEDVQNFIWLLHDPETRLGLSCSFFIVKGTKAE